MIILTNWVHKVSERELDVPCELEGFIVHFELCNQVIVEIPLTEEIYEKFEYLQVDNELHCLIDSAKSYLPALTMAKIYFEKQSVRSTEPDFIPLVKSQLERALLEQPTSPATLVRSRKDEFGYRDVGEFVWALRVNANSQQLTWIASDGCVYTDDLDTFEMSETQLQRLSQ